jgi:hypothetical protein
VRFAVLTVVLIIDSCLHEYHPVVDKWHFGRACCPYLPGPSRPWRWRQPSSSNVKIHLPINMILHPKGTWIFNTRYWLSNVCVCVWIGPNPIFCHLHLVLK